jgi:hypothetical protein
MRKVVRNHALNHRVVFVKSKMIRDLEVGSNGTWEQWRQLDQQARFALWLKDVLVFQGCDRTIAPFVAKDIAEKRHPMPGEMGRSAQDLLNALEQTRKQLGQSVSLLEYLIQQ